MKNIFAIFESDVKRIATNWIALVVAVGIMILPSLYAWFNIEPNWDPYGNTKGVKVAVASVDEGVEIEGAQINIGELILDKLRANEQIGWQFVEQYDAVEGVKSGKYYATIVIPEDFSRKIASILTADIQRPQITYYVNEKKNAIATKITDKGVSVVQQEVNKTFISTATEVIGKALHLTDEKLGESGGDLAGSLVSSFQKASDTLGEIQATLQALEDAAVAVDSAIDVLQISLPEGGKLSGQGQQAITDVKGLISSSRRLTHSVTDTIGDLLYTGDELAGSVRQQVQQAAELAGTDLEKAASLLEKAREPANSIIALNERLAAPLRSLGEKLPELTGVQQLLKKLDAATAKQRAIVSKIDSTAASLRKGGASAENALRDLLVDVDAGRTALSDARTEFSTNVSPQLGTVVDGVFGTLDDLSGLLSTLSGPVDALGKSLDSVQTALEHSVSALQGTGKLLAGAKQKLDGVVLELQNVQEGQLWQKLSEIMSNDPATAAGFMAEPVRVETESLYPIANYGSAMTPFYTVLCLWVGGLVLIAILKVKVHDEKQYPELKPWQAYFGRYLLFLCCGIIQALIACLGDLYILRIQCPNPGLFILAGVVSSVVFTLFIYTLTVSFGDVGKAIAVIFLVIQVAGAGGTFPIEVTPRFFNIVNPLLPFTSSINAMRETIAGLYSVDYWIDLLKVCAYIPVSLLIGLVLRKPVMKVNDFFNRKLEETHLM